MIVQKKRLILQNNMQNKQQNSLPRSYQKPINGVYAFDLKVNVDFNTGHLSLNVPPRQQNFNNHTNHVSPPQSMIFANRESYYSQGPAYSQLAPQQNNYVSNGIQSNRKIQLQQSNTTYCRADESIEAVQCVICQRMVKGQEFTQHIEAHRNRKKDLSRVTVKQDELSIRNKNQSAEVMELVRNQGQTQSFIPDSLNFSHSNIVPNSSNSFSFTDSRQSISIRQKNVPQGLVFNTPFPPNSFNSIQSHQSLHHQPYQINQQPINGSISHQYSNFSSSGLIIPPSQVPTFISHNQYYTSNNNIPFQQASSNQSQSFQRNQYDNMAHKNRENNLHFHRIQSMIIRPQNPGNERIFQQCGQSVISRNSLPTKYSQIYAIQQQMANNKYQSGDNHSSSSQQSIKVFPSKSYRTVGYSNHSSDLHRSNYTQKLSKTKLPVNYLARQQFITSSRNSNSIKSKITKP